LAVFFSCMASPSAIPSTKNPAEIACFTFVFSLPHVKLDMYRTKSDWYGIKISEFYKRFLPQYRRWAGLRSPLQSKYYSKPFFKPCYSDIACSSLLLSSLHSLSPSPIHRVENVVRWTLIIILSLHRVPQVPMPTHTRIWISHSLGADKDKMRKQRSWKSRPVVILLNAWRRPKIFLSLAMNSMWVDVSVVFWRCYDAHSFTEVYTGAHVMQAIINYFRCKRGYVLPTISSLRPNCHLAILFL